MKINRSSILRHTNYFQKGEDYYLEGKVGEVKYTPFRQSDDILVSAFVNGSEEYFSEIRVDKVGNIKSSLCTCPTQTNGLCKHCVALALKASDETSISEDELSIKKTDNLLFDVIDYKTHSNNIKRIEEKNPDGIYDLVPVLRRNYAGFYSNPKGFFISFKFGQDNKLYTIKNIDEFIKAVRFEREIEYGKKFTCVHRYEEFTEKSRKVFKALNFSVGKKDYLYKNEISLSDASLVMFLNCYFNEKIMVDNILYDVIPEDEIKRITFKIKKRKSGCEIEISPYEFIQGVDESYILINRTFFKIKEKMSQADAYVFDALQTKTTKFLKLSERDFVNFATNVLPVLEKYANVIYEDISFENYIQVSGDYYVFMHAPNNKQIECICTCVYKDKIYDISSQGSNEPRDFSSEKKLLDFLRKYFPKSETIKQNKEDNIQDLSYLDEEVLNANSSSLFTLHDIARSAKTVFSVQDDEQIFDLVRNGLNSLKSFAKIYVDETIHRMSNKNTPKLSIGVQVGSDLLTLDMKLKDININELNKIIDSYKKKQKFYRLKTGDFLDLEGEDLETAEQLVDTLKLSKDNLTNGEAKLPLYRAFYIDSVLKQNQKIEVDRTDSFKEFINNVESFDHNNFNVPKEITAELRNYQIEGFKWLCTLCEYGLGGILADDMGLGKTLQLITLVQHRVNKNKKSTNLVVCPASLIYNWEAEINRFAPKLTTQIILGNANERKNLIKKCQNYNFVITSYDLLKRDIELYEDKSFDVCIIDEAQFIKNAGTQCAFCVKKINSKHHFALTGTPIENKLSDLWSIFDFLMPGYLFSYLRFKKTFENSIVKIKDERVVERLTKMVSPFLLRRKKSDVLKDLPSKIERPLYITMTDKQTEIYNNYMNALQYYLHQASDDEIKSKKIQVLAELTRLRQICCSPELCVDNYAGGSGKMTALLELLQTSVEDGHNVLIFSQFTSLLEIAQKEWCKISKEPFLYLSGADSKIKRQRMVDDFQNGKYKIFFISLKAGGTGLNLTNADTVIHCDPWWNLAAQNQATDRAHRIGQKKVVNVIKLVAKNTIEEKIVKLQETKAKLAESIIENSAQEQLFDLTKDQLLELFDA
ncbi:MAG: DEAD/DEAH box helicase [Alphaproteobacteria bacterium]|nr:DEAD/DEAH box helicase [Alphaproteobacteria bacterium]